MPWRPRTNVQLPCGGGRVARSFKRGPLGSLARWTETNVLQPLETSPTMSEDAQTTLTNQSTQLAELQERLDFAERLLAQARDRSALGAGEKRG